MQTILKVTITFIVILITASRPVHAMPDKDSAAIVVQQLSSLYKTKDLSERDYLDTIPAIMHLFQVKDVIFSNAELLQLLSVYRDLIWDNTDYENYKQVYYAILCGQASKGVRNGEMLYYAEKLGELEHKNSNTPSITSLMYVAHYYITKMAFTKNIALYHKHRQFITGMPVFVLKQSLKLRELINFSYLVSYLSESAYRANDSLLGKELENTMDQLIYSVRKVYPNDRELLAQLQFGLLQSRYEKKLSQNRQEDILQIIQQLDELSRDPGTPKYFKQTLDFTISDKKALFYLVGRNNDSAGYYINLLDTKYRGKLEARGRYMVKKYQARLLYNKGLFNESEDTLIKALELLEVTSANTVAEADELMYALTKAEEQQFLLADSSKRQKKSDRRLVMLSTGIFFLLSGSLIGFGLIRYKQKARFLHFKLSLARNIHDETNPALLYARTLAKLARPDSDTTTKTVLEKHIEHAMQVIRGLAHDLKSHKLKTIGDLNDEITESIRKLNPDNTFTGHVTVKVERSRPLSYHQFSNLRLILMEAISNTIKHAFFSVIDISIFSINNQLYITYKDNGEGWDERYVVGGIGIRNMQERVTNINGTWHLDNHYPEGYQISISLPIS